MTRIDIIRLIDDGIYDRFVCGYNARFASTEDLVGGHSYDGYALETFHTPEAAEKWYSTHIPDCHLVPAEDRYLNERWCPLYCESFLAGEDGCPFDDEGMFCEDNPPCCGPTEEVTA